MRETESKTAWQRYQPIIAVAVGVVAIFLLARTFFPSKKVTKREGNSRSATSIRQRTPPADTTTTADSSREALRDGALDDALKVTRPIVYSPAPPLVRQVGRNIFAYFVPPAAPRKSGIDAGVPVQQAPAPTPPPPLILASVSPPTVYARTGDFALEIQGDKFTPETLIHLGGSELPTRFVSPQKLTATVSSILISSPGQREVIVRTRDNGLYSNNLSLNVAAPPTPPYLYVGLIGGPRYNDTALLKDQNTSELINVQRGDIVGGRFRITSMSDHAIEFTDTQLGIKHRVAITEKNSGEMSGRGFQSLSTPPRRSTASTEDEEP